MLTDQRFPGPIRTPQKIIDHCKAQSAAAVAASSSSSTDEGQRDLNKQALSTAGVSIAARDKQTLITVGVSIAARDKEENAVAVAASSSSSVAGPADSRFWWQLRPEQCTCDMPGQLRPWWHMCENCCKDAQSRDLSLAEYDSMREKIRIDEDDDQLLRDAIDQSVAASIHGRWQEPP